MFLIFKVVLIFLSVHNQDNNEAALKVAKNSRSDKVCITMTA